MTDFGLCLVNVDSWHGFDLQSIFDALLLAGIGEKPFDEATSSFISWQTKVFLNSCFGLDSLIGDTYGMYVPL